MKKSDKTKVKEVNAESTETTKRLKNAVEGISVAVDNMRSSGVSEDAILTLIRSACGSVWESGKNVGKPTKTMITAVIKGMEELSEYVFPEGGE